MNNTEQAPRVSARARRVPWRAIAFVSLLAAYVLFTLGVVYQSPLLTVDRDVLRLDLRERFPDWYQTIHTYVMLGQRGPSTLVALPWFIWRAWKSRSARPLVTLVTALFVLNLSVGVVKLAVGRLGPLRTHNVNAVFEGGNIFPSGHVSNAVVLYGVIAMLVASTHRRAAVIAAVVIAFTVGMSTIYLDTHWLTDVVGGWMAGGLVLLVLPTAVPYAERVLAASLRGVRRAGRSVPPIATPRSPVLVGRVPAREGVRVVRERRPAAVTPPAVSSSAKAPAKV